MKVEQISTRFTSLLLVKYGWCTVADGVAIAIWICQKFIRLVWPTHINYGSSFQDTVRLLLPDYGSSLRALIMLIIIVLETELSECNSKKGNLRRANKDSNYCSQIARTSMHILIIPITAKTCEITREASILQRCSNYQAVNTKTFFLSNNL